MDDWRDLGGFRTIRHGALVRARSLDHLSAADRAALHRPGVRTLIDLRNEGERAAAPAPAGLTPMHLPLDGDPDASGSPSQLGDDARELPALPRER